METKDYSYNESFRSPDPMDRLQAVPIKNPIIQCPTRYAEGAVTPVVVKPCRKGKGAE